MPQPHQHHIIYSSTNPAAARTGLKQLTQLKQLNLDIVSAIMHHNHLIPDPKADSKLVGTSERETDQTHAMLYGVYTYRYSMACAARHCQGLQRSQQGSSKTMFHMSGLTKSCLLVANHLCSSRRTARICKRSIPFFCRSTQNCFHWCMEGKCNGYEDSSKHSYCFHQLAQVRLRQLGTLRAQLPCPNQLGKWRAL